MVRVGSCRLSNITAALPGRTRHREEEKHMSYITEQELIPVIGQGEDTRSSKPAASSAELNASRLEPVMEGTNMQPGLNPNRFAEAGRKGAQRIHQLVQEGKLYEQEHGLKRGRQRIRQLIEQGKLYEEEHGLRLGSRKSANRLPRVSSEQVLLDFCQSLHRLVKARYRAQVLRMIEVLGDVTDVGPEGVNEEVSSQPETAA